MHLIAKAYSNPHLQPHICIFLENCQVVNMFDERFLTMDLLEDSQLDEPHATESSALLYRYPKITLLSPTFLLYSLHLLHLPLAKLLASGVQILEVVTEGVYSAIKDFKEITSKLLIYKQTT